jgi:hypothetical protein
MSSLDAFNDMMAQFLNELVLTFPEEINIQKFQATFDVARTTIPRSILDGFMSSVGPHSQKLMAKDESFFLEHAKDIDFLKEINLDKVWTPNTSPQTKAAIWQYLQTLHILGTTLTMFPPETLEAIENAAKKCAESGAFDPAAMQGLMSGLMGGGGGNPFASMMGGGGGNPFAALMGGAAQQQARPRPGQRQVRRRIEKKPAQKNPGTN